MLKGIAFIGAVVWFTTILFVYNKLNYNPETQASNTNNIRNWRHVVENLERLKEQNIELHNLLEVERKERSEQHAKIISQNSEHGHEKSEVRAETKVTVQKSDKLGSFGIETNRRLLDDRIREMFYLIHGQNLENDTKGRLETQMISLMGLSAKLEYSDGVEEERKKKRAEISETILSSIERLQNPEKCDKARTLVCTLDKECGFGCQLHHVAYCAITAFATQRMMVLSRDGTSWKYSRRGWTSVFEPISKCSHDQAVGAERAAAFNEFSNARVVGLGIVDSLAVKPTFLPQAIPSVFSRNLSMVHSHPPAFFVGTFISYLMRFNNETIHKLDEALKSIPLDKGPVVGLQIRRTDKIGTEAAFHPLSEYMLWTEYWFQVEEKKLGKELKRQIFIASDDPTVVPEAKKSYPNYEVYGSTDIAQTAQLTNRYTDASLMGVITDIYILSRLDYLVCTFSSQVCRMGYELRQPNGLDDGSKFHSLDDIYYFGGQQAHEVVAIEDHTAANSKEIDLKIGDKVGIAGNHWDGYSKGQNRRTNKIGVFPSYKVVNQWITYDFKALLT